MFFCCWSLHFHQILWIYSIFFFSFHSFFPTFWLRCKFFLAVAYDLFLLRRFILKLFFFSFVFTSHHIRIWTFVWLCCLWREKYTVANNDVIASKIQVANTFAQLIVTNVFILVYCCCCYLFDHWCLSSLQCIYTNFVLLRINVIRRKLLHDIHHSNADRETEII